MFTTEKMAPYSYYWTDPFHRYVLVKQHQSRREYIPFDLRHHVSPYLFENEDMLRYIIQKMLESGVPVYDEFPGRANQVIDFSGLLMVNGGMSAAEANRWERVLLEIDWKFTDELLRQGKKYSEIIDARDEMVGREIDAHLRRFGLKE